MRATLLTKLISIADVLGHFMSAARMRTNAESKCDTKSEPKAEGMQLEPQTLKQKRIHTYARTYINNMTRSSMD